MRIDFSKGLSIGDSKRKFLQTDRKSLQNRLLADFEDLIHQNTYNLKVATPRIERFKFLRI